MVAGSAAGMSGGDAEWSRAGFGHGPLFGRELDDSSFAGDGAGELVEFDAGGSEGGVAVDVFDDEDPHLVAPASCWTAGPGSVIWTRGPPSGRAWSSRLPL